MICGVKIVIYDDKLFNRLTSFPESISETPINETTGEILYPKKVKYRHMIFSFYESKRVEIRGSLHKYWKGENWSDFSYSQLVDCVNEFCEELCIDPQAAKLTNLEFGVNISPVFDPFEFCDSLIAYKGGNTFEKMRSRHGGECIGFHCEKSQYAVKVYDKGKQYIKHENLLRFEVSVYRMRYLSDFNVNTLSDILNRGVLTDLTNKMNDVMHYLIINDDSVCTGNLDPKERGVYFECVQPKSWGKWSKKIRNIKKKQFENILDMHGTRHWKRIFENMVLDKWRMLLNT